VRIRRAAFTDAGAALRLIQGAIEHGCREHYDPEQRQAIFLSYAERLFVEMVAPLDTIVAERAGELLGFAQLDPAAGRVRAVFVAAREQGRGVGRALLECLEQLARERRIPVLRGAMSLNAVPFYRAAGFAPARGARRLQLLDVEVPVLPMAKQLGA
jgi:GNAT superfamily N-acetyltransferase